jgi:hypothetical protein
VPLRYALHRFLVQGWRRCQGLSAPLLTLGNLTPTRRQYFSGRLIWAVNNAPSLIHPGGYERAVDKDTGALFWRHPDYPGHGAYETAGFWGQDQGDQGDQVAEGDMYEGDGGQQTAGWY